MNDEKKEYRSIFKSTAIFGGVQVFSIIVSIVRSKAAAIFLGTEGVGIFGLFTSTLELIRNITGLGINASAVREISYADGQNDANLISKTVTTVRKLCWGTGLLGMITVIVLSPLLSQWTFGNNQYTWSFIFLSAYPLMIAISFGQLSVLQGLRKIKYLAKANLYGGAVGLLFLIPLYWLYGIDGIVPVILSSGLISLIFSFYFARTAQIQTTAMTVKEIWDSSKTMVKLGVMLTLSGFVASLGAYLVRIYIAHESGTDEVGLFTAATAIVTTYIGLVFTAMGTDFFPRLSAVSDDNNKMAQMINKQAQIGILILAPMIVAFIMVAPLLLEILYSSKFIPVAQMMRWMMLGVLLQASSWPLAYSLLAKANNKMFLFKEIGSAIYSITFSIIGYNIWGLDGLGIGFVVAYICNLIQGSLINKILYNITLSREYYKVLALNAILAVGAFLSITFVSTIFISYLCAGLIFIFSCWRSYKELNKRIGITEIIKNKLNKNKSQ